MNTLATRLIAAALALGLLIGGLLYVQVLRVKLSEQGRQLDDANQQIANRDQTIKGLRDDAKEKVNQQQQLDASTDKVMAKLSLAREDIRKVINENPTVRAWADTPLPADVIRLSGSPAATGANAFSAGVPAGDAVHAARDGADH
ncbi:LysB family phage lysis regulatory protein [Paraburkholderia unamae]|uniref:Rz-like lysis system protein LysB n=1 Tax=Paraburkholderia unamae TaxID=219649 RepID=UPI000DC4326E|nr:Rz-like lysis system protein LysB [Paraburkholderia unamae]RAR53891.1 LysB family phage lysis regulatory protein [Paraburkholderia unamae]